jgi:putative ABC transport system substrate-binding protein
MNNRRKFIIGLGAGTLAAPFRSLAKQQDEVLRVGVLSIGSAATARHLVEAFFKSMADLAYQEGRDVHYEVRYGEGSIDKFERYAREHVGDKADLIWASGTPAATAAQNATGSIPVVFALVGDPVYSKLVRSLQAPGANLTGMSLMISEMWEKRVEILTEIFPTVQRIGVLYNPLDSSNAAQLPYIQKSAQQLGKQVMIIGVHARGVWRGLRSAQGMASAGAAERRIHAVSHKQAGASRWGSAKPLADCALQRGIRGSRRRHRLWRGLCGKFPEQRRLRG